MNKKQIKEFNRYKSYLNITTKAEEYILKLILKADWGRQILLSEIRTIKENDKGYTNFVHVECTTNKGVFGFGILAKECLLPDTYDNPAKRDLWHKMS